VRSRVAIRRSSAAIALAVLVAAPAARAQSPGAGTAADRIRAEDVFALEYAGDPQISPDGTRIVYARQFADKMTDQRYTNLWIVNADGTNHRQLTSGNVGDASPRWSPDGTRLLFSSNRGGSSQLWVYWLDGGQMQRVTNVDRAPGGAAWSPDGRSIAYTALVPQPRMQIAQLPAAPQGASWAAPARVIDRLVYQFNEVGELEPGWAQLFVASADGGAPRQLSTGAFHTGGGLGRGSGTPSWTPDGKHILISANRRDDWELEARDTEIYEYAVANGAMRKLTDRRGPDDSPVVSPDGKLIAYTGFDDRHQGYQVTRLYVMNRDGSGSRVVAGDLDRDFGSLNWTADGSGIVFSYDDKGDTKVGLAPVRGGAVRVLAEHVGGGSSAYSGGSFSFSPRSGRVAFSQSTTTVPSNVAISSVAGTPTRTLTHLNDELLTRKKVGEVEEIWYASSKDGKKMQGWIIKPPNFDPSKKYPLIIEIHGGPFANYGGRFDIEKQAWASADYVVLYTNPRGSTSYGEEFGNLIHHSYPGDDFYDLNSGVDAVIAKGYVDPENLYVTGGSGGGVLTAWMIGHTTRFRGAVVQFPVINWYSFALTSDIPSVVNKYWFPAAPWDSVDQYHRRSLTSIVNKVKTPTMIITGEADYRTPMSESEQYFQALKISGVDAVLVKVPEEPHGITRRPSHHMQKIAYIQGWMDLQRSKPKRANE
jgi:acylaminoacyl-peptidase